MLIFLSTKVKGKKNKLQQFQGLPWEISVSEAVESTPSPSIDILF